ncbi:ABC transporter permease [Streptomyces sp. NPDC001980]|uniref:ABC transporter permease n=1 Tax=Streptomyces sp. NPDC001980 TaxID=3157126 RepID=UPI00331DB98D
MRPALHAEWTKLRTVRGPLWLLLATVVATVALSAGAVSVAACGSAGCGDPTRLSLTGVRLGQAPVVVLAVLVMAAEYGTGMIGGTLTAMPRRITVLAAKAVTLAGIVAAAGTVAVLGSLTAGGVLLPGHTGTAATHGRPAPPPLSPSSSLSLLPSDGPTLRAALGSVLYLTLIALLGLGVATVVRDSATGIGIVLGLLYLFPLLSQAIGDPHGQRLLQRIGPMSAGLAVQATTGLRSLPIGPWAGLGVTAGWAAAALLTGGLLLYVRDA